MRGETAADRRTKRTARRRLARRKQRINWLQELFAPFIDDKTFFIRLNNSQYLPEDKDSLLCGNKNNLFENEGGESKFYKKFPTIYHLRKALMDGGNFDIRLYYLALHHIIKYRALLFCNILKRAFGLVPYSKGLRALLFCNILKLAKLDSAFSACLRALLFCNILKQISTKLSKWGSLRALLFCNILKQSNCTTSWIAKFESFVIL